jgi:lipid-A-disaccharide synthase
MTDRNPSVLIVAGEASGDLHGSKVVARLRELAPGLRVFGVGGDRMKGAGVEILFHADDFAVVGFVEIVGHVPRLKRAMDKLLVGVEKRGARLAILIDYPGFNLVLARRLREAGVRVLYYISPQVWAWGEGRVRKIAARVDRMAVVLPFEAEFYRDRGFEVEFVGHPLLEEQWIASVERPRNGLAVPPVLGLLPGSRRQEVASRLLRASMPNLDVRLGLAAGISPAELSRSGQGIGDGIEIVEAEGVRDLMRSATALIVSSGTATLEAACVGTPMVIVYRMAPLSYLMARALVHVPLIGLVNVVAGEEIVPEFVQHRATAAALAEGVRPFLTDGELAARTSSRLLGVRGKLGLPGASDRVARMALSMIEGKI